MDAQWTLQRFDHEEGSAARWHEVKNCRRETRDEVRALLLTLRRYEGEDSMFSYRITQVGSYEFFSQPTDALEY